MMCFLLLQDNQNTNRICQISVADFADAEQLIFIDN